MKLDCLHGPWKEYLIQACCPGRDCNARGLSFQYSCCAAEADLALVCLVKFEGLWEALGRRPEAGSIGSHCVLREGVHQLCYTIVELVLQRQRQA